MADLFMRRPHLNDLPPIPEPPLQGVLRRFKPNDRDGLAALLSAAFPHEAAPWTPERTQRELLDDPTVRTTWLILVGPHPAATASSRLLPEAFPNAGYVHWVAADPAHAGKRLGYTITLAVLHELSQLGCHEAVLETQDFRFAAIKTYQNLGFALEDHHRSM